MEKIIDFLTNLMISQMTFFYLKMALIIFLTFGLLYLVYSIYLKIEKAKIDFVVHSKLILLKSISITIVLYNF
jgi:hypothetical protein